MTNTRIQKQTTPFYSRALVDVSSIIDTEKEKSFEVVFATENPVQRTGWDERFNEILSCQKENMRTGRLDENAVPLLDNHDRWSGVTKQMGTVVEYRVINGECRAKILFSTQERFAGIWQDIKAGIIRSISTGYNVYKYVREVVEGSLPNYRAIDWEPLEISLAPVPADYKSKVRSENESHEIIIEDFSPVQIIRIHMEETTTEVVEQKETINTQQRSSGHTQPATVQNPANETQLRNEGVQAERGRVLDIQTAVRNAGLEEIFANDLITRGIDINAARAEIINKLAEKNTSHVRTSTVAATITVDETEKTRAAMSDALLHRAQPGSVKLEDKAHDFRFMSMLDMARHCLELKGEKAGRFSPSEVIKRALSTTDYPNLLNSTVERSIRRTYDALPAEWKSIAKQTSAKDFREKTGIAVDGKVTFEEVAEGGEYKHSILITDDAAKIKLKTYGRMIKITRQAIINDDLSVFDKLPKLLAQGAANFQADKVWGLIINNAKTPDGTAIFHAANHKNLPAAGGAISETTLNAARTAMYRMKTPAGELMPVEAKYLIVPIELEMTAKKILSAVIANAVGDVNVFANAFQILTSPRLLDASAWYLAADPATTEGLVYAYLEGEEGLYIEKEVNFNDDTVSTKARLDFDAAAWDYRSWYKNPGA